jgi:hypothetical protein
MKGLSTRFLSALAALIVGAGTLSVPDGAYAQGFSSISTSPSAAPVVTTPAPASKAPVDDASAGGSPVSPAASKEARPAAQFAALSPTTPQAQNLGGAGPDTSSPPRPFEQADKILVDKSDRKLYLLRQGRVVAEYPIKLGLNPYGHKQQEGDFRTPEGSYTLNRRNPRSEFFLAIQVSYPNREDAAWAKENGWDPGGLIMIHGQPNVPKRPADFYSSRDWTDGCIALSNGDMVDVWLRTSVGLPIEIRP